MKARVLTALGLIPPVVYLLVWAPLWLFLAILLVVVERSLYEYFHISAKAGSKPLVALGYVLGAALCLTPLGPPHDQRELLLACLVAAVVLLPVWALFSVSDLKHYLGAVASTLLGVLYIGLTLSFLIPLHFSPSFLAPSRDLLPPRLALLFLFLVIWAGDIFAYLVGRAFGRTPLFPAVSPNKTVEGSLAGLAGSLLVAGVAAEWFWHTSSLKTVILWSGVLAITGQFGDLVESALKRGADVKDSGTLLPGHGGLLDRIDSLLLAAPVFWLMLSLNGR
jgi:phosphatidate cytidylyltransferase